MKSSVSTAESWILLLYLLLTFILKSSELQDSISTYPWPRHSVAVYTWLMNSDFLSHRYNPENLATLERYVETQARENSYDLEANLAVLKLWVTSSLWGEVNQARTQNRLEVLLKTLCGWLKEPTRCRNVRSWHFVGWGNHFFSVIHLVGLFNLPVYFNVFYVNVHDEMFVSELSVRLTESLWCL